MSRTDTPVRIGGMFLTVENVRIGLQENDPRVVDAVIAQIKFDRKSVGQGSIVASPGLDAVADAFGAKLASYLEVLLGGDYAAAEEAYNDTLEALQAHVDKYDREQSAFGTTLFNLAKVHGLRRKRTQRMESYALLDAEPAELVTVASALTPNERAMRQAFSALSEREQAMLHLTAVQGMRPADVAKRGFVDVEPANARMFALRARAKLRAGYLKQLERGVVPATPEVASM